MLNNQTYCVIAKVIADYDYIWNVIEYDYGYIASGIGDYDYLISCNRLQSITITDYDYPNTDAEWHNIYLTKSGMMKRDRDQL
jgi:hypothetical protein